MRMAMISAMLLFSVGCAEARLAAPAIESVSASPSTGAQLPLALTLKDEAGISQPYACQALCGPILSLAAGALERSGLQAGRDYRLVVVGLDPRRGPREAKAMKMAQIGESGELVGASSFLSADAVTLQQLASALGYRSVYDEENDQFAHPAAVFVLTAEGRVARTLSALGVSPEDLRLALVEAGQGRIGSTVDTIRLLCYGFDPASGRYTPSIHLLLALGWLLTAIGLGGAIGVMVLTNRRASAP